MKLFLASMSFEKSGRFKSELETLSVAERLALQASNVVLGSVINLAEGSECKRVETNMQITRILEGVGVGGNLHDES